MKIPAQIADRRSGAWFLKEGGRNMKMFRWLFFVFVCSVSFVNVALAKISTVDLMAVKEGSAISGIIQLEEVPEGLKVNADVKGVLPGKYGFHFHENGSCADEGKAAGGHFNPDGVSHGLLIKDGFSHAHAGDMGNIEIGPDGAGKLEM